MLCSGERQLMKQPEASDYDVFICHADRDKKDVVRPLIQELRRLDLRVWVDEEVVTVGDFLGDSIKCGMNNSRHSVVVISPAFVETEWARRELRTLVNREVGTEKIILPILHNFSRQDLDRTFPELLDRLYASTSEGLNVVAEKIKTAIAGIQQEREPPVFELHSHQTESDTRILELLGGQHLRSASILDFSAHRIPHLVESLLARSPANSGC
jgi:hypothetical protein